MLSSAVVRCDCYHLSWPGDWVVPCSSVQYWVLLGEWALLSLNANLFTEIG